MDSPKIPRRTAAGSVAEILESPEIAQLIADIEALHIVGRKGYGVRTLLDACLVKHLFNLPTWTRVSDLIGDHDGLQRILGGAPSNWAL